MDVIYSIEEEKINSAPSIFLAGPTSRDPQELSWRPAALYYLNYLGFNGRVFVPEPKPGLSWDWGFEEQVEWEERHLIRASKIVFWIPRSEKMPGYTTNIEFGRWSCFGKIFVGWPENSLKMRYIAYYVKKLMIPSAHTLYDTLSLAVKSKIY